MTPLKKGASRTEPLRGAQTPELKPKPVARKPKPHLCYPSPSHGTPTRTSGAIYLSRVLLAAAARQPEFSPALDGADCQRDRRLVLHAIHLHAAASVDRARQLSRAGFSSASAAADSGGADRRRGKRPLAPQACHDCRRPGALWHRAGYALRALAFDGVAGLSLAAGGDHHGCVL